MVELGEVAVIVERKPVTTRRKRKAEQLTRDRKAAEAARTEYERLQRIAREAAAEEQAPAAQRSEVIGFTADSIRADRLAGRISRKDQKPVLIREATAPNDTKRGGYRRASPLFAMHRRGKGRTITHDHLKAAERLRNDFETGILGGQSPRSGLSRDGSGGTSQDEEFVWLAAAERYRHAMASIAVSLRSVVDAVVIAGQAVPWIARAIGQSEETATGLVVAGLDCLADHYDPQRGTRAKAIERALAGLQPLGFDFAISAIGEVIPQDRIGRGRKITA